jgi:glutathione S-transferase
MLEETGIKYETKLLEYGTTMKSPEYLAINPAGKVPAIKHGDVVVTESAAICAYLADIFKDSGLAPNTDKERGAYYRWLFFTSGPLEQALGFKNIEIQITSDHEKMLGCGNINRTIDILANTLSQTRYIAGDRFTAADVYVGSHIGWGLYTGGLDKRPEFVDYYERVINRPAKKRADEIDNALMANK